MRVQYPLICCGVLFLLSCAGSKTPPPTEHHDLVVALYAANYKYENYQKAKSRDGAEAVALHYYLQHESIREELVRIGYFDVIRVNREYFSDSFSWEVFFLDMLDVGPLHEVYPIMNYEEAGVFVDISFVPNRREGVKKVVHSNLRKGVRLRDANGEFHIQ